jgi:SAM-dependent methyltransferase
MNILSTYIMEDPREAQRLLDKVDPDAWIAKFLEPHLVGVKSFLSVGCGPGVFLRELANSYPMMNVVGVDVSSSRVRDAAQRLSGLSNARVHVGDAMSLPFDTDSFDLVFSRFLLEYVPDKQGAVREMARVCTPGGVILLQDLDGQLIWHFPEDSELQAAIENVLRHMARSGFDPFVGRKLFSFCLDAALTGVRVQVDPYHLYAGSIGEKDLTNWQAKLEIAQTQIKAALGSDQAAQEFSDRFLAYLGDPETLTYSCLFTVTANKPAASNPRNTVEGSGARSACNVDRPTQSDTNRAHGSILSRDVGG